MNFEESENIIVENASDVIYAVIEITQILTKKDKNDIKIKIANEDKLTVINITANNIDKYDFSNLELLTNNIEINDEKVSIKL